MYCIHPWADKNISMCLLEQAQHMKCFKKRMRKCGDMTGIRWHDIRGTNTGVTWSATEESIVKQSRRKYQTKYFYLKWRNWTEFKLNQPRLSKNMKM